VMVDWSIAVPSFLTALVEWVEAFTIVLAVSLSIGWRGAIGAALAGLATLAVLTAVSGGLLATGIDIGLVQFVIGVFLMLFGVRWLAKAIARYAGLKPLHDEAAEFAETRAQLSGAKLSGDWAAGWTVAFKGVLLEGLEVWLVVVALGTRSPGGAGLASSIGAALAALLLTCLVGAAVRAPLQRVPENTIKFVVGAMIVSFGTYWTMEGIGGEAVWPYSDWTLLILGAFYLLVGLAAGVVLRNQVQRRVA
jgi:uncharacterized membrane protein